jgi:nicotinamide mononucleotide transporter
LSHTSAKVDKDFTINKQSKMDLLNVKNTAFTAWNYPMSWIEVAATITGLLAVWLSAKEKIINWPIGLMNVVLSFFVFYQFNLYSDMLLQIYFFATGILGWWQWSRRDSVSKDTVVKIEYLTRQQQIMMVVGIVIATFILGNMVSKFHIWMPDWFKVAASFPYADSLIMVMSVFGNFLLAIKKIESWILWVLVDVIAPIIYFQKEMYLFTFMYVIFLAIATFALLNWLKLYKNSTKY